MNILLTLTWDMSRGLEIGPLTLRYYSLLFAGGFVLGYFLMKGIFRREGIAQEKLDSLLTYVVIATVVGARLGHVFFYQWDYYRAHPGEILKVWEGGLASHGAAIAIIIAVIVYSRKVVQRNALWTLDRVVLTVALAACLIRVGNFFNSEIYGQIGNSEAETVFVNPVRESLQRSYGDYLASVDFALLPEREITDSLNYPLYQVWLQFQGPAQDREAAQNLVFNHLKPFLESRNRADQNLLIVGQELHWDPDREGYAWVTARGLPRAPSQLYEALAYLLIFFVLYRLFMLPSLRQRHGLFFGLFLLLVFGFRFVVEYGKEVQVSAEQGLSLNIGQQLSLPAIAIGIFFIGRALLRSPGTNAPAKSK